MFKALGQFDHLGIRYSIILDEQIVDINLNEEMSKSSGL